MSLVDYRRKRHFSETPEPEGKSEAPLNGGSQFVIQKHAASHLHYDFRLEMDGTLKSWAVPHGPCLDPSQKRLAVQVEDHPVEYGAFEGTIPAGQYGGGTVIIWDRGTWEPLGDADSGFRDGKLKFVLHGEKLHGTWNLIRMKFKSGGKPSWLLIKERDQQAVAVEESDILLDRPESVVSGKTIDQASETSASHEQDGTQEEDGPRKQPTMTRSRSSRPQTQTPPQSSRKSNPSNKPTRFVKSSSLRKSPDAVKTAMPESIEPQLATLVETPPEGPDWLHEMKFDGYRLICYLNQGKVLLHSRNQLDWTVRFPELAAALRQLPVKQAVLDGELVALSSDGKSSFQELQKSLRDNATTALKFYAFDLLYLDGYDLRELPLELRRQQLRELIPADHPDPLRFSIELEGTGQQAFERAAAAGLEGIVSKRRDRPYQSGRGGEWLKAKSVQQDEFVIGGFTDSTSSRKKFGALLLGVFDDTGNFKFAGKVGTGFSEQTLRDIHEILAPLEQKANPFAGQVLTGTLRGMHWVKPKLVAQIGYTNWTRDGRLRHPTFQGLREDKAAPTVVRDRPVVDAGGSKQTLPVAKQSNRTTARKSLATPATNEPKPRKSRHTSREVSTVELTHPDRIVYPSEGITKQDLATYYSVVAPWILPHIENRPLSLLRCPDGQAGPSFFQKHIAFKTSPAIGRVLISEKNKSDNYMTVNNLDGLTALVQMGVMEIHPWASSAESLERPDRMIFDLDPDPAVRWAEVVEAAMELRQRLRDLKLESFVKTTGGKGLHVVVPLAKRNDWSYFKAFSKAVANQMVTDAPQRFVAVMSKAARKGKIFIDYLRNDRGSTAIAPYSTRARDGAPVATPLAWEELSGKIKPDAFNLKTVPDRLAALKQDPWEELGAVRQSMTAKMRSSVGL